MPSWKLKPSFLQFFYITCSNDPVRNTAACFCMVRCISRRSSAVEMSPLAFLSLSKLATEASPAFGDKFGSASPGLFSAKMLGKKDKDL